MNNEAPGNYVKCQIEDSFQRSIMQRTPRFEFCMRHTSSSDYIEKALVELVLLGKMYFCVFFIFNIIWQIYKHTKNQLMLHKHQLHQKRISMGNGKNCVLSSFHLFRKYCDIRPDFDLYLFSVVFFILFFWSEPLIKHLQVMIFYFNRFFIQKKLCEKYRNNGLLNMRISEILWPLPGHYH